MKNLYKVGIAILLFAGLSCEVQPVEESGNGSPLLEMELSHTTNGVVRTTVDVINPILNEVTGTSTLHRNSKGSTVNFKTTGLTPGYAYTLWWVIWNNPEECQIPGECMVTDFADALMVEPDILYASGHVVGESGKGNFSGRLNVANDAGSINELLGLPESGGLQEGNAFSAEVHLVLRSHGPAIPGLVNEQINSFQGGCDNPFANPPFTVIPDEPGECGDIEFAIHPPVS